MDFETRVAALDARGIQLLFAGICHDKRRPKYWAQLYAHPVGAYAYGNTLSEALTAAEAALSQLNSPITLEDLDLT